MEWAEGEDGRSVIGMPIDGAGGCLPALDFMFRVTNSTATYPSKQMV